MNMMACKMTASNVEETDEESGDDKSIEKDIEAVS